jgi:hypothetical protein
VIIGIAALLSVMTGTALAYLADHFPVQKIAISAQKVEALQVIAGVLLIGGFALIGSGLPPVL